MAGFKSLVTVLGVLCVLVSRNHLGVGAQEATTLVLPVSPSSEATTITAQAVVPDENVQKNKSQEAAKQGENSATTLADSKVNVQEAVVTTPAAQQEDGKKEKKPEPKPVITEKHPEAVTEPPKQNPKTDAQAGEKGKDSKGSAATLYTSCGLVLLGAILLRL